MSLSSKVCKIDHATSCICFELFCKYQKDEQAWYHTSPALFIVSIFSCWKVAIQIAMGVLWGKPKADTKDGIGKFP